MGAVLPNLRIELFEYLEKRPLTNRVQGPYCKLRTKFCRAPYINGMKRGSVTYSTDRENEECNIFSISLRLIRRTGRETFKFSGLYSEIRPAKLTNHAARTN